MATGVSKTFWGTPDRQIETFIPDDFYPVWSNPVSHENKLFFGDNLLVLRDLLENESIKGHVKLIYIDPPYSTNMVFQTRQQEDAYTDLLKGEDYISFMSERLYILRELLADDGSIFVHLDANMIFHIKVAMDEIFGSSNFRGMITRQKCRPKNYTKKTFGNISDYILYYSKNQNPTWNRPYQEWTDEKMLKEYQYIEEGTGRRYKKVPIHAPGIRNGDTGREWRGMLPPPGKHWQYTPNKLDEMDAKGEIYWSSNGNPRRKVYLDTSAGIPIQDIWLDCIDASNQNTTITGYPTEKNPKILERIIEAASNEGDIVLDCFAGSGTTLTVASELKRRWVGIDCSETAIRTILNRFLNGTEKMGDFVTKNTSGDLPLFGDLPTVKKQVAKDGHQSITDFSFYIPTGAENNFSEHLSAFD